MTRRIILDKEAIFITISVTVILLIAVALPLWCPLSTLWISIPFLITLLLMFLYAPYSVSLEQDAIIINRGLDKKRIPYTDIQRADRIKNPDLSWRLFASGGFMGYWGKFRNRQLGVFQAYIGIPADSILLTPTNGNPIIFSCADPDTLLPIITAHLHQP